MNDVSTTRALVLGLTLGALLSGGACVGRGDCTAANCGGCCDEAGECRTGNTASACGLGGAACISCGESVCKADGTCFVSAQVRPVPVDDAGLPFTEDGGFVEADAGARVDGGAPPDAGLNDGGPGDAGEVSDAGSVDAGILDAGILDAGILDAGVSADAGADAGLMDAGIAPDAGLTDAGVDAGTFLPRDQCTMPIEVGVPDAGNFTDAPVLTFSGGRLLLGYAEYLAGGGGRSLCQTRLFEDGGWGPVVTHGAGSQARPDPRGLTLSPAGNAALVAPAGTDFLRSAYARALNQWFPLPWTNAPLSSEATLALWSAPEAFFHAWYSPNQPPRYATLSSMGPSADTVLSASSASPLAIAAARTVDDDVAFVWAGLGNVLRGRFVSPMGLKMGGEAVHTEPSTVANSLAPAVLGLPGGNALVVWERRNRDLTVQLMAMTLTDSPTGPTFDLPTPLVQTTSSEGFLGLQGLVDDGGDITLTWISLDQSTRALRRLAGTWGTPVVVGPATDSAATDHRRAVIDADGHVTVLYRVQSPPGRLEHRRIARGSATWRPAVRVSPASLPPMTSVPGLALDAEGAPVIVYRLASARSPILATTCR